MAIGFFPLNTQKGVFVEGGRKLHNNATQRVPNRENLGGGGEGGERRATAT